MVGSFLRGVFARRLSNWVARVAPPKSPPAPYTPTLDEIMEVDAKLRMLGGLDPAPKKRTETRKPSSASVDDVDELP